MAETDHVVHDPAGFRYVLMRGDRELGETSYRLGGGVITFVHTAIDPELQEKGLGSKLVAGALDLVRAGTDRVAATCPFVKRFLDTHDDYADLTER